MLTATWLAEMLNGRAPEVALPAATGVTFHSGRLRPGDAFFALPGEHSHGIRFADEALARGAAFIVSDAPHPKGVLVERPAEALLELGRWARAQRRGAVIGITGSAGKTSTKALAAAALGATASPGNLNTPLALAAVLVNSSLESGGDVPLVLEMGIDHRGEMARLVELVRPSHGLLTLVAPSHLAGLGDLATVAAEKAKLLEAAPEAFASVQALPQLGPELRARVTSYGLEPEAAVRGRVVAGGERQTLEVLGQRFTLPYPGEAMARNAVGALALAAALGVPLAQAAARLEAARLEPGRLQLRRAGGRLIVDDSYNSNPASAAQALAVLRELPPPRVAILGDMLELGAASPRYHRELGEATRDLDLVIAVGPEARAIAKGNPAARHAESLQAALPLLRELPREASVLVKGSRGMRLEQLVELLVRQGAPA